MQDEARGPQLAQRAVDAQRRRHDTPCLTQTLGPQLDAPLAMRRCPACDTLHDEPMLRCPHDGAELVELIDPVVGSTLSGRYLVVRRIGVGGMGSVYAARHLLLQRDVALKLLAPKMTRDPVMRERFLREAQTTSSLRHPNIVEVYDVVEEGRRVFLVMELLEGESLASRLNTGPMPVIESVRLMIPVASALSLAHGLGVVHRDLKPENLFVARGGDGVSSVKVVDFGIAFLRNRVRLTAPGQIFGTPGYLAPEIARGEHCVPASDLYALGVVLFELITGSLPFDATDNRHYAPHRSGSAPSARERNHEVPERLDALLRSLLHEEPSARPPSAAAVEAELQAVLADLAPVSGLRWRRSDDEAPEVASVSLPPAG